MTGKTIFIKRLSTALKLLLILQVFFLLSCKKEAADETDTEKGKIKVGLVFDVGGRGDKSFNDAAYKGLENAKKTLGIDFEVIDPGDGADRESALRLLASKPDINLVFGIGFIFSEDITRVAKDFPQKKFACVDYTVTSPENIPANLTALVFKEEEGSFLVGCIAGLVTKTNTVGFIGGMESALIKKFETGFEKGAKYVNPAITVLKGYVGVTGDGFKNPGKAQEIALSQYSMKADIIYHASGLSGLGLFEAARDKKKLAIGVDLDQYYEAPGFILTSMVKKVDEVVLETIKDLAENQFKGGVKSLGLKDNGVDYVYDDNNKNLIDSGIHRRVEEIKGKIISGEIVISNL
ncbi:MAG: BMP family ABC transporter substrate-binding protein [Ignavibacteria bacterium]|nr:BMP family ABC transporter substrate-binding protein [Ignavibacteria bacterium]